MKNDILKAEIKNVISEYGTADSFKIGTRIMWGSEKLKKWLMHPFHGFEDGADVDSVCRDICNEGWRDGNE